MAPAPGAPVGLSAGVAGAVVRVADRAVPVGVAGAEAPDDGCDVALANLADADAGVGVGGAIPEEEAARDPGGLAQVASRYMHLAHQLRTFSLFQEAEQATGRHPGQVHPDRAPLPPGGHPAA